MHVKEKEMGKQRMDNPQGTAETHTHTHTHTQEYIYFLTHTCTHGSYMMRVSLKQSVNQSHTNSQGSLVAISAGVDAR